MGTSKKAKSALISVFHKDGLAPIIQKLNDLNITIYSTGGTEKFMKEFNFEFNDTVETIVDNILSNPHNDKWQKRDTK